MNPILKIPRHIAIIMDGNGRWAERKEMARVEGHRVSVDTVENVIKWSVELGVEFLTLYSFSTENWKRPKEEVEFLFNLLKDSINKKIDTLKVEGVRLLFMGRIDELPEDVARTCRRAENETGKNERIKVIIALNYGGRAEIVDAVRKMLKERVFDVNEKVFRKYLYLSDVPDPDLIIRTGGEKRLSNFLLWQAAYSELFFSKKMWPEFDRNEFIRAIEDFSRRERRFGGVKPFQGEDEDGVEDE